MRKKRNLVIFLFLMVAMLFGATSYAQSDDANPKTSFKAQLMNIEATGKDAFRFNTTLHNGEKSEKIYQLQSLAPEGWMTTFQTEGSQVTSVRVDSDKTQNISIEVRSSPFARPGKYAIPILAISGANDSLRLNLEAVIKGDYNVEITTPTGRLSEEVVEGRSKIIQLKIKNSGTLPLDNLELTSQAPTKWTITYNPAKIERLEPGKDVDVYMTTEVPDKTIAGDYIANLTVKNNFTTANTTIRFTVTTSLLAGWMGILIILIALGIVYYLVRKYGRR